MATDARDPIPFAGATLDEYRHVCAFFDSTDDKFRVLSPFIGHGLERGEQVIQVVDPALREEHRRRLVVAGIDVEAAEAKGQLQIVGWQDAHLRGGRVTPQAIARMFEDVFGDSAQQGFPLTRVIAAAEWAHEYQGGTRDLVEAEAVVNGVLARSRHPVV